MHHLQNSRVADFLLEKHRLLQSSVDATAEETNTQNAAVEGAATEAEAAAEVEAAAEEADAEVKVDAEETAAAADDAAATVVAAAGIAPKPHPDTQLSHICDFYATGTESKEARTWDLDAWQEMVRSNCPEFRLQPSEWHGLQR